MKKRILSIVLAAIMVVGLLPTVALADESVLYITLPEEMLAASITLGQTPVSFPIQGDDLTKYSSNAGDFGYKADSKQFFLGNWKTCPEEEYDEYPDGKGNFWTTMNGPYAAGNTYGKMIFIQKDTLTKMPDKLSVNGVLYNTLVSVQGYYYCILNLGALDASGTLSGGDLDETDKTPHTHGEDVEFVAWTDELATEQNGSGKTAANSLPGSVGSFYLTDDVTLSETWTVPAGTVNLCLNGHTVKLDTGKTGSVIKVPNGAVLNLYDCSESNSGKITGGNNPSWGGGGVYVEGSFTMNGGTICENEGFKFGGGVYVANNGTFIMNDGVICDNTLTAANGIGGAGVAVYVYGSASATTFTMNGGTISGNKLLSTSSGSAYGGGGVYVRESGASFTMNGGTITGNSTAASNGGGIYVCDGALFEMKDSEISNNTAGGNASGGGVSLTSSAGEFVIDNCKIINNTAYSGGGIHSSVNLTLKNTVISGNHAGYGGGGVRHDSSTLKMDSGVISGNTAAGTSKDAAGGINGGGNLVIGGTAQITGNTHGSDNSQSNVYRASGKYITIGTGTGTDGNGVAVPADGMLVGVTSQYLSNRDHYPFTNAGTSVEGDKKYFFSDDASAYINLYNKSGATNLECLTAPYNMYVINAATTGHGAVYLSQNSVLTSAVATTTITVTVVPTDEAHYELTGVTAVTTDGSPVTLNRSSDTVYTFKVPSKHVMVLATFAEKVPTIKVEAGSAAAPVYGTASGGAQLYTVTTKYLGTSDTLTVEWKGTGDSWDGSAPAGVAVDTDGKVTTAADTPAGEYVFRISSESAVSEPVTLTVAPKSVTVTDVIVADKTYDGKTDGMSITGYTLDGKLAADELTLSGISGTYADADADDAQTVDLNDSTNWALDGADAANYVLADTQPTTATGKITPFDLSSAGVTITLNPASDTYTGSEIKPAPTVTFDGTNAIPEADLEVSYTNNTNAALSTDANAPTVTVKDKRGNLAGSVSKAFTINKAAKPADAPESYVTNAISANSLSLDDIGITLDGAAITAVTPVSGKTGKVLDGAPAISTGAESISWTALAEYSNTESDQYTLTVSSDNFEDFTVTVTFAGKTIVTVSGVSMAYPDSQTSFIYGDTVDHTGTPAAVITADSTGVTIPEYAYTYYGSDGAGGWTVLTAAPADAGSYKLIISAVSDDYVGKQEIPFTIEKKTVELIWTEDDFTYDGTDQKSMITVRFVDNDGGDVSLYFTLEVANANGGASVEFRDVTPFGYVAEVMDNTANENKLGENYRFPAALTKSYTMKPAPVTVFAIPVQAKTYNGRTDDAVLLLDSVIFDTVYGSDELTVSGIEGTYASANASDAQTVTLNAATNWALGGASKANYVLADTQPTETTGEIARFDLSGATVTVDPNGYTYDEAGVEPVPTVTFDGTNEIPASDLNLSYMNNTKAASAADANAPTVTVTDQSGNLTGSIDAAFTINKAAKPADVPETCTIGATAVSALSLDDIGIDLDGAVITAVNAVSGKTDKVLDGAPAIDAGAESISWTVLAEPSSTESDQYTLTITSDNYEDFTVTVTFTGKTIVTFDPYFTVDNKTYDGSEMFLADPTVTVDGTAMNPQPELTVTYFEVGSTTPLDGAPTKAGAYKVVIAVAEDNLQYVGSEEYTFTIEPAEITVSGITAKNKQYDGTTAAELDFTAAILTGLVSSDDLSVTATGTFADANVGTDKPVTISDLTLTGSDAANYELAASGQQTTAIASIICGVHDWTNKDGKCAICGYECDHDGKTDGVCDICGKELNAAGNTDSELEVLPSTPAVTESGLSKVAEAEAEDGKQVRLTMTVEAKPAENAEGADKIAALPEAQGKEITYLDISIAKFVNGEFDCYVTDTDTNLVTLKIPFETAGKNIGVIRYHENAAEPMDEDPAAGQEGFTVGTGIVTIYASKFSTYAIVYEDAQPDPSPSGPILPTTYPVNGPTTTENGKLTISTNSASEGEKVTLTAKPDEGYELDTITVTDKNGREIALTDLGNGKFSFVMPDGKVNVSVTFKAVEAEEPIEEPESKPCPKDETCPIAKFDDTTVDFWWHDGIHYCLENGLMKGVSDSEFNPNGTTSRAMIVTILWRLEGEKVANYAMNFSDVAEGEWYTEAIRWAASEGIVLGYDDGTYKPNKAITREELAAILYRYAQMKGEGFVGASMFLMPFEDLGEISDWASESVRWCYMHHIILGRTETTFVPKATATRAEAATMIQRFCESLGK